MILVYGKGPQRTQNFRDHYLCENNLTWSNKIQFGDNNNNNNNNNNNKQLYSVLLCLRAQPWTRRGRSGVMTCPERWRDWSSLPHRMPSFFWKLPSVLLGCPASHRQAVWDRPGIGTCYDAHPRSVMQLLSFLMSYCAQRSATWPTDQLRPVGFWMDTGHSTCQRWRPWSQTGVYARTSRLFGFGG